MPDGSLAELDALLAKGAKPVVLDEPQVSVKPAPSRLSEIEAEAAKFGLRLSSGHRSPAQNARAGGAAGSYHLTDRARDFSGPPDKMLAFAKHVNERYGPELSELFFDPWGGLKNGQALRGPIGGHNDHVHVAYGGPRSDEGSLAELDALLAKGAKPQLLNAPSAPAPKPIGPFKPIAPQPAMTPALPALGRAKQTPAGPPVPAPGSRYRTGVYLSPFTGEAVRPRKGMERVGRVAQQFLLGGTEDDEATNAYYQAAEANPKIAPPLAPKDATEREQAKRAKAAADRIYNAAVQNFAREHAAIENKFRGPIESLQNQRQHLDPLSPQYKALEQKEEALRQQMAGMSRKALGQVQKQLEPGALARELSAAGPLHPYAKAFIPSLAEAKKALLDRQGRAEIAALIGAGALIGGEVVGAVAAPAVKAGLAATGRALADTTAGKVATGLAKQGLNATARATRKIVNQPVINPLVRGTAAVGKATAKALAPDEHAIQNAIAGAIQQPSAYIAATDPKDVRADRVLSEALQGAAAGWFLTGGFKLTGEGLRFVRDGIAKGLHAPDLLRQAVDNSTYVVKQQGAHTPLTRQAPEAATSQALKERTAFVRQREAEFKQGEYAGIGKPATGERFKPPAPKPAEALPPIQRKPRAPAPEALARKPLDVAPLDATEAEALARIQARRATRQPAPEPVAAPVPETPAAAAPKPTRKPRAAANPVETPVAPKMTQGPVIRYEAGKKLTKDERSNVLKAVQDTYIENNVDKVQKGISSRGEEIWGYPHAPETFRTSDITGKKVRHYITLPDGRIAHPSELFPDIKQSEIDKALIDARNAERQVKFQADAKNARVVEGGFQPETAQKALELYGRTRRPADNAYWATDEGGRVVRVDGSDPKDVAHFESLGFKKRSLEELKALREQAPAPSRPSAPAVAEPVAAKPRRPLVGPPPEIEAHAQEVAAQARRLGAGVSDTQIRADYGKGRGLVNLDADVAAIRQRAAELLADEPALAKAVAPKKPGRKVAAEKVETPAPEAREPWQMTRAEAGVPNAPEIPEVKRYAATERIARERPEQLSERGKELLAETKRQQAARSKALALHKKHVEASNAHLESVRRAIAEGKPVPAEVLAEYPYLAPEKPKLTTAARASLDAAEAKVLASREARIAKEQAEHPGGGKLGALGGYDPEDIADFAQIAAIRLAKGTLTAADFAEKMVREFGEEIRPHLDAIWQAARTHWDELRKQHDLDEWDAVAGTPKTPVSETPPAEARANAPKPAGEAVAATETETATVKPKRGTMTRAEAHAHEDARPQTTAVSNQKQSREVEKGVLLREPEKGRGIGRRESFEKGKAEAAGKTIPEYVRMAEEIGRGERDFRQGDVSILTQGKKALVADLNKVRGELDRAIKAGSDAPFIAGRQAAYREAQERLQKFADDVQKGKTGWSNIGRELQQGLDVNYGNFEEVLLEASRRAGREIKADSREGKAMAALSDQLEKVQAKLKELESLPVREEAAKKARQRPRPTRSITEIRASREANAKDLVRLLKESKPVVTAHRVGDTLAIVHEVDVSALRERAPEIAGKLGALAKDIWEEGAVGLKGIVEGVRAVIGSEADSGVTDSDIAHEYLAARNLGQRTVEQVTKDKARATREAKRFVELEERLANGETLTVPEVREHRELLKAHQDLEDAAALKRREADLQARKAKLEAGPFVGPPEPPVEAEPHIRAMLDEIEALKKQHREAVAAAEKERLAPIRAEEVASRKAANEAKALARQIQQKLETLEAAKRETVAERAARRQQQRAEWEARKDERHEDLKALDAELEQIRKEQRAADSEAALQAKIDRERELLEKGDFSRTPAAKKQLAADVAAKQAELRRLQSERRLRGVVADLEQQAELGISEPQGPPKPKAEDDEEMLNLRARRSLLEAELRGKMLELEPASTWKKTMRNLGVFTSLRSSGDLSASFKQGLLLSVAHPITATKAFVSQLRAFGSKDYYAKMRYKRLTSPNAALYKRARLELTGEGLGPQEEAFMSKVLPDFWTKYNYVDASDRAYNEYLNFIRTSVFDTMIDGLKKSKGEAAIKDLDSLAWYVNYTSGRGGTRLAPESAVLKLTGPLGLFSARYHLSRLEFLAGQAFRGGISPQAKKILLKEYLRTVTGLVGLYGAAYSLAKVSAGDDVGLETDPTRPDVMLLRIGKTRLDLGANLYQVIRNGARIATGKVTTAGGKVQSLSKPGYKEGGPFELAAREFRNKLAPIPSTALSAYPMLFGEKEGKDPMGRSFPLWKVPLSLVAPMTFEQLLDSATEDGWQADEFLQFLNALGISTNKWD